MVAMYVSLNRERALARSLALELRYLGSTNMSFTVVISIISRNSWLGGLHNLCYQCLLKAIMLSMETTTLESTYFSACSLNPNRIACILRLLILTGNRICTSRPCGKAQIIGFPLSCGR